MLMLTYAGGLGDAVRDELRESSMAAPAIDQQVWLVAQI